MKLLLFILIIYSNLFSNELKEHKNLFQLNKQNNTNTYNKTNSSFISTIFNDIEKQLSNIHNKLNHSSKYLDEYITNEINDNHNKTYLDSYIKIENSFEKYESEKLDYEPNIDIRIKLPKLKEKLSISIENNDKELVNEEYQDSNEQIDKGEKKYNLGLLYSTMKRNTQLNLKLGISSYIYGQIIISKDFEIDQKNSITLKEKVKYSDRKKLDLYSIIKYTHLINPTYSFHNFNEFYNNSNTSIDKVYNSVRLHKKISKKRFINYVASIQSDDYKSSFKTKEYKTYISYRNFIKKWLYYDIVPSVKWQREDDFNTNYGLRINLGILIIK